jgi:hypothetical protein
MTDEPASATILRKIRARKAARDNESNAHRPHRTNSDSNSTTIRIVKGEIARMTDEAEAALIAAADAAPIMVRAGRLVQPIVDRLAASDGRTTEVTLLKPLSTAQQTRRRLRAVRQAQQKVVRSRPAGDSRDATAGEGPVAIPQGGRRHHRANAAPGWHHPRPARLRSGDTTVVRARQQIGDAAAH